jgi:hypothetical protein
MIREVAQRWKTGEKGGKKLTTTGNFAGLGRFQQASGIKCKCFFFFKNRSKKEFVFGKNKNATCGKLHVTENEPTFKF